MSVARRCRSQPKPWSWRDHSSLRRLDVEDREALDVDAVAGEDEAAGIDVERDGGIGGAQIDRRDQQALGHRPGVAPAIEEARVEAEGERRRTRRRGKAHLPTLTGRRSDRHRRQSPHRNAAAGRARISGQPDYHPMAIGRAN